MGVSIRVRMIHEGVEALTSVISIQPDKRVMAIGAPSVCCSDWCENPGTVACVEVVVAFVMAVFLSWVNRYWFFLLPSAYCLLPTAIS